MKRLAWLAVVLGIAGCVASSDPPRRLGAAADVGQGLNNAGEATVPAGGTIVFEGDDLIYGLKRARGRNGTSAAPTARSQDAIPDLVFKRLGRRVTVQIHARPGDKIKDGIARWKGQSVGDLLVVCYGYGDAAVGTAPHEYLAALTSIVSSARAAGTPVFLISPPNSSDVATQHALGYYREAIRSLASRGTGVFEAQRSLDVQQLRPAPGGAQDDQAYIGVAGALLEHIRVAPRRTGS